MRLANFATFFACGEDVARNKQGLIPITTLAYRVFKKRWIKTNFYPYKHWIPIISGNGYGENVASAWREKKEGLSAPLPKEIPPFKAIPVRPDGTGLCITFLSSHKHKPDSQSSTSQGCAPSRFSCHPTIWIRFQYPTTRCSS